MAKPKTDPDAQVTESSGNVFTDLGFAPGEVAVLALRADLMGRLRLLIEERGWSQVEAAQQLGIGQSRVSDLGSVSADAPVPPPEEKGFFGSMMESVGF